MNTRGISGQVKRKLIEKSLQRKLHQQIHQDSTTTANGLSQTVFSRKQDYTDFGRHPAFQQIDMIRKASKDLELVDPFFRAHEGTAGATSVINGQSYINFSSYNYLGLNGDPRVNQAAAEAMQQYGTSVSASRMVSGERPIHAELERALADCYQAEDAIAFVSGHATNVTVIGHLMQPSDLILHDEWIHNSAIMGAQLSGAKRMAFRHNDTEHLSSLLDTHRRSFKRILILTEGLFSMDGDHPDLARLVEIKNAHQAWLMVDEAHALGVLGDTGHGLYEATGVNPQDVDIWMGTLSKTLSGCGGYIAGSQKLVDLLRYLCPGFLYSVGMPAPLAAASLASLQLMLQEPHRVKQLASNSQYFLTGLKDIGCDTGHCAGRAVIPLITGSSIQAARLSQALFDAGVNVQPVTYPAVPEKAARLRFFISSAHTQAQLDETLSHIRRLYTA